MSYDLAESCESRADTILWSLTPGEEHTTASLFPDVVETKELFALDSCIRERAADFGLRIETVSVYRDRMVGLPFHIPWVARELYPSRVRLARFPSEMERPITQVEGSFAMEGAVATGWDSLERLVPLCMKFAKLRGEIDGIDSGDTVLVEDWVLGSKSIDGCVQQIASRLMADVFESGLDEDAARDIAEILVDSCRPVVLAVIDFAKGGASPEEFVVCLNRVCLGNAEGLQRALAGDLGVPRATADCLAEVLGPYAVSVACLASVCKIFHRAAEEADLAKRHRIEAERLSAEAIALLKVQRHELEETLSASLLGKLEPFSRDVAAMDSAVLEGDDDGYVAANVGLWKVFGREIQYENSSDFDKLLLSEEAFRL